MKYNYYCHRKIIFCLLVLIYLIICKLRTFLLLLFFSFWQPARNYMRTFLYIFFFVLATSQSRCPTKRCQIRHRANRRTVQWQLKDSSGGHGAPQRPQRDGHRYRYRARHRRERAPHHRYRQKSQLRGQQLWPSPHTGSGAGG